MDGNFIALDYDLTFESLAYCTYGVRHGTKLWCVIRLQKPWKYRKFGYSIHVDGPNGMEWKRVG